MTAWAASAKIQRPDVEFETCHWIDGADPNDPVSSYHLTLDRTSQQIKQFSNKTFVIVGHSSGCAVANELAERVFSLPNWHLVVLDGFRPDKELLSKSDCWGAKSGVHCSRNFYALRQTPNFHVHQAPVNCTANWPLHFSLVNLNASNENVNGIYQGYVDCKTNLEWLERE